MRCYRVLLVAIAASLSTIAALEPPQPGTALAGSLAPATSNLTASPWRPEPIPPIQARILIPPALPVTDNPPPFGTVLQEWELPMSGPYAGAGITWRRDSERFYLMDQAREVWSVSPSDPPGTLREENWVMPNMGAAIADIPWGLAWDNDSSCFWISDIVDGNIYGSCYYVRMRQTAVGDTWRWFSENPCDTWLVGTGSSGGGGNMYWLAGCEKWLNRGYFVGAPVATGTNNHVWKFDPYTKTDLGRLPNGSTTPERGVTLVPWDSNYVMTTGFLGLFKRDSTGFPLESVPGGPAGIALWMPRNIGPDDTVSFYAMCSDPNNTLQRISVGMLWSQLPGGMAIAEPTLSPAQPAAFRIEPSPCRGTATIRLSSLLPTSYSLSLYDASGRLVHSSLGLRTSTFRLDLRSMPVGVYVLRLDAGTFTRSEKLVLQH